MLILEAGPRVTRGEPVARFRNSPRRSDWMSPHPLAPWAPHPVCQPQDNGYLEQAGPYPYAAEYIRQVGATSWHWAAHAWRNVPNDVRIRSLYAVGVDWPFGYDDLEPFYQEAEELTGVSGADNTGSPRPFPMEPVAEPYAMRRVRGRLASAYPVVGNTTARNSRTYAGRPACVGNNSCQPTCPVDAQYHGGIAASSAESAESAESAGAKVLPNANVYRLEPDAQGRILALHNYDPDKGSQRVTGGAFVVAATASRARACCCVHQRQIPARDGQRLRHGRPPPHGPSQHLAHLQCRRRPVAGSRAAKPQLHQHHARRPVPLRRAAAADAP